MPHSSWFRIPCNQIFFPTVDSTSIVKTVVSSTFTHAFERGVSWIGFYLAFHLNGFSCFGHLTYIIMIHIAFLVEIFVIGLSYDFGIAGPHTSVVLAGVACLVVVLVAAS
jgi:hypothetical protein